MDVRNLREVTTSSSVTAEKHFQSWFIGIPVILHDENKLKQLNVRQSTEFTETFVKSLEILNFYKQKMTSDGQVFVLRRRKGVAELEFSKYDEYKWRWFSFDNPELPLIPPKSVISSPKRNPTSVIVASPSLALQNNPALNLNQSNNQLLSIADHFQMLNLQTQPTQFVHVQNQLYLNQFVQNQNQSSQLLPQSIQNQNIETTKSKPSRKQHPTKSNTASQQQIIETNQVLPQSRQNQNNETTSNFPQPPTHLSHSILQFHYYAFP